MSIESSLDSIFSRSTNKRVDFGLVDSIILIQISSNVFEILPTKLFINR